MTKGGRGRRVVLIATLIGATFFLGAAALLWRILPERAVGEGIDTAEAGMDDYTAPEEIPVVLPEAKLEGISVAVLEIPENADMAAPGYYAAEVARWREWLDEAGARAAPPREADVLVLPHAECLGSDARRLIADHLGRGKGIVSTGALGTRDGFCAAAADTVLTALFQGEDGRASYAWPLTGSGHMVFLGETMLAAGIPAGARIDLEPTNHVVFRGPQRGVYYSDFERRPVLVGGEEFADGAIARSIVGNGRVVAFGFGISEVRPGWSERIARLAVANAVTWSAGSPVLQLAGWPDGYSAAAVVAQDVEADYGNAGRAITLIEATEIPTTYFIVGQLAERHPWLTRRMAEKGEIGSHSYHHRPMDRFTAGGQEEELGLSKRTAEEFYEAPVAGFRPPQERFNLATLEAWAEVGGDYVFASDQLRSAAPVIVPIGPDSLVFLGRVIDDDFELLSRDGVRDRGAMVRSLVRQIDAVVAFRGAYMFSYHSHMLAQEQLLPVLDAVVQELKDRPEIWIATAGDVASWWRARAAIETRLAPDGASAMITNRGDGTFEGGTLIVDLPDGSQRRVKLEPIPPGGEVIARW